MLIACWSPKGGSGTTVVSTALALILAGSTGPSLLVDLAGDVPATLGLPEPTGPGLSEWLAAGPEVPDDALSRLEIEAGPDLRLLPLGGQRPSEREAGPERPFEREAGPERPSEREAGPERPFEREAGPERAEALVAALGVERRAVVADCGHADDGARLAVAAGATLSLLVLRPCYLALRRALAAPLRASGVVLVGEQGRSLGRRDVEEVLGVPVRAEVGYDPAVARAVDAGLLSRRVPRGLERSLRQAA